MKDFLVIFLLFLFVLLVTVSAFGIGIVFGIIFFAMKFNFIFTIATMSLVVSIIFWLDERF